jgi:hypothetical protein
MEKPIYELKSDNKYGCLEYYGVNIKNEFDKFCLGDDLEKAEQKLNELNNSYFIYHYTEEERIAFWESLDLTIVNEYFSKMLGTNIDMKLILKKTDNIQYLYDLKDENNIAPTNAITDSACEYMNVHGWSPYISVDKDTGDLQFHSSINLKYKHWGGGTNGATIGYIFFSKGEWKIYSTKDETIK